MKMKFLWLVMFLNIGEPTHSGAQEVKALHPLFTERTAFIDSLLLGTWSGELGDTLTFRRAGDNFYHLLHTIETGSSRFEAILARVDDKPILDILPRLPEIRTDLYNDQLISSHSFYYVSVDSDTLRLAPFSHKWFYNSATVSKLPFHYTWFRNGMLLTGSSEEISEFVSEHIGDSNFFDNSYMFYRLAADTISHDHSRNIDVYPKFPLGQEFDDKEDLVLSDPRCLPSFPYLAGWLGGDGTLSVPLTKTKNLWLFADSFVGRKNQTSRNGAHVLANTIAISDCDEEKGWYIEYYWRNKYTEKPQAFFESHSDRYKYWPAAAFTHESHLYVVLNKVGAKTGTPRAPDDIFAFSLIGTTLAKVMVTADSPENWKIELLPWSHVFDPNDCRVFFKYGEYLYAFMGIKRIKAYLTRLPLNRLENPEHYLEYFGKDRTWKRGLKPDDAEILIEDVIGGSVWYHIDLKKWVMIYGPNFDSNRILLRTSSELTGPWSQAVVLYEAPEQIKGSQSFDPDNFCYGSFEHFQFYDSMNQRLLITYDANSKNFSKLLTNKEIYYPRVLSIEFSN